MFAAKDGGGSFATWSGFTCVVTVGLFMVWATALVYDVCGLTMLLDCCCRFGVSVASFVV